MREAVHMEHDKMRLLKAAKSIGGHDEVMALQGVEVLKRLVLGLLKEVEALEKARPPDVTGNISLYEEVRRFEAGIIRSALMRTSGHQGRAARLLGVKLSTLNTKIKRYQICIDVLSSDGAESSRRANPD